MSSPVPNARKSKASLARSNTSSPSQGSDCAAAPAQGTSSCSPQPSRTSNAWHGTAPYRHRCRSAPKPCLGTPTSWTNKAKPPQHHTEAARKCPLLLKADTRNPLRSHFFNSLSHKRTVRPEGAEHQWRKMPPRELSVDLLADERGGRVTNSNTSRYDWPKSLCPDTGFEKSCLSLPMSNKLQSIAHPLDFIKVFKIFISPHSSSE